MLTPSPSHHLQIAFLKLLPRIAQHGRIYFRYLGTEARDEALAEMTALSWLWFVRLVRRGKDPFAFPSVIASFAARGVCSGRRLCGQESAGDVLSPQAQRLRGFTVGTLPEVSSMAGNLLDEALHDNTQSPVDEQVCFRIDFPAWRAGYADRDRQIIDDLMQSEKTTVVADRYRVSPTRISQMRGELRRDWDHFCGTNERRHVAA